MKEVYINLLQKLALKHSHDKEQYKELSASFCWKIKELYGWPKVPCKKICVIRYFVGKSRGKMRVTNCVYGNVCQILSDVLALFSEASWGYYCGAVVNWCPNCKFRITFGKIKFVKRWVSFTIVKGEFFSQPNYKYTVIILIKSTLFS